MNNTNHSTGLGSAEITIRLAVSADAEGIAETFLESAEHHARLDPQRYSVPEFDMIAARYREGRQHPTGAGGTAITLVAELGGQVAGFVDARLEQSPDPMHREITYCHISEIAVSSRHQNQGIGGRLLRGGRRLGTLASRGVRIFGVSRSKYPYRRLLSATYELSGSVDHCNQASVGEASSRHVMFSTKSGRLAMTQSHHRLNAVVLL